MVAHQVARDKPTMKLGGFAPDIDINDDYFHAVVLHEFGHALGLRHEQGHPHRTINFDQEAIYADLLAQDWSREQVDQVYLNQFSIEESNTGEFDKDSIMLYPIDAKWTADGVGIPWRMKISNKDKVFVATLYADDGQTLPTGQRPSGAQRTARTLDYTNLRLTPGHVDKPTEDVIAVIDEGAEVTVIEGPADADGLRWWRVVRAQEFDGWVAEATADGERLLAFAE